MSRKALEAQLSEARSHLAEAQRELELSTFLNKGVLQSNSEFKLRIAELEQENTVLRVAESRLARTEDRADLAERRVKEVLAELKEKESQWAGSVRAEAEVREGMEIEMDTLRDEVKGWREIGEKVGGLLTRSNSRAEKGTRRSGNAVAGPSRPSRSVRSTPVIPPPVQSASKPETLSSRQHMTSPMVLLQSARIHKRRRRIEDSGDQSEDDPGDDYAPPSPIPDRTPTRPTRATTTRTTRATSSSAKKRDAEPEQRRESSRRRRHSPPLPTTSVVKVEDDESPARESEESEDDPLYLE